MKEITLRRMLATTNHGGVFRSAMRILVGWIALGSLLASASETTPQPNSGFPSLDEAAARIIHAATNSELAFQRLCHLCDTFGPRFSGTTNLEAAIDWVISEARRDGFENVHGEPVSVPRWVRGQESLALVQPRSKPMAMAGLGGSVGTPAEGIEARVLVVKTFDELKARASEAKGKIVLFNAPFTSYGDTVAYRYNGANAAAKVSAVASLVRSITPSSLQTPHTGAMHYDQDVRKIPHAAITIEDAEMLQRLQDGGSQIVVRLKMEAQTLPRAMSRNVIAELTGREKPSEIVVVSGHIDSWDITVGAMDDAGGVLAAWEGLRLLRELGLRPRRTIRLVLWTNEENGTAGASSYQTQHLQELPLHALAIESDMGVFQPSGFVCAMSAAALDRAREMARPLSGMGAQTLFAGGASTDLGPMNGLGVPCMELQTKNDLYFRYHHTSADTPDKINPSELNLCAAAMAFMAYAAAESPAFLPRRAPNPRAGAN